MPRRTFAAGSVTNATGAPLRLEFYPTSTSIRREADLWTIDGSNNLVERIANGVIVTDSAGAYSAFAGPDDLDTLYALPSNTTSRTTLTATGYVSGSTVSSTYGQLWTSPAASTTLTGTLAAWVITAVDCTAGAGARTLPAASSVAAGVAVCAKKADTSSNNLVVSRAGSDLIFGTGSGATSKTLSLSGEAVEFVSNGVDKWTVRSSDTPSGALASTYVPQYTSYLANWFAGGIRGKKIVALGDSTTDFAYGLSRPLWNLYTRPGRELDGVSYMQYGVNGQTLAGFMTDTGRHGLGSAVLQNADLYILCYGVNDVRTGTTTQAALVTLLESTIDQLTAAGANVLLRMPATFTTTDTSSNGFVVPNTSAQAYSTLLRNAYKAVAVSRSCALLDTQALIFGVTSLADTSSPLMLNQIHPNDAGNAAVARELVKMIGTPPVTPTTTFSMNGRVAVGVLGRVVLATGGKAAVGNVTYKPSSGTGTATLEFRQFVANAGSAVVLGTMTLSAGASVSNIYDPGAAADMSTLAAGDGLEVAVTACTMTTQDLDVQVLLYPAPRVRPYPLYLTNAGFASFLDDTVTYSASQAFPSTSQRSITNHGQSLKALKFYPLGTNKITKYDADFSQSVWVKTTCTVAGTARAQTITATGTAATCYQAITVLASTQYTFSWQGTTTSGSPRYAIYDQTNSAFITSATAWPAADGNGWRSATVTTPVGCTTMRVYPVGQGAGQGLNGDTYNVTATLVNTGAAVGTYAPTNSIGSCMVVTTGALPSDITRVTFIKVDTPSGTGVASPGVNTDGNPGLQVANSVNYGYTVIGTRGNASRGANGSWQVAVLRATGGNCYATCNDQSQSGAYAKAVNLSNMYYNLLSSSDTTGSFQTWTGELIEYYFPYLLTEGEASYFVRTVFRTLVAAGETISGGWELQRLV